MKKLSVDKDLCIERGLCAEKCPVEAIQMENNWPVWKLEKCEMCLGCLPGVQSLQSVMEMEKQTGMGSTEILTLRYRRTYNGRFSGNYRGIVRPWR